MLILDDSTSAVDTQTDAMIRQALATERPEVTKIIIAQRVSSLMDADKIVVMDGGEIVAVGKHADLIRKCAIYREVYQSQNSAAARANSTAPTPKRRGGARRAGRDAPRRSEEGKEKGQGRQKGQERQGQGQEAQGGQEGKERGRKGMSMRATVRPRGGVSLKNMDRAALKRLVGYIMRRKGMLVAVLICIALSSIANVASSLFLQSLIDDYIAPLLLDAAPVFTGLLKAIVTMGCIYVVGILSSLCYNRLMATVAQSTLKDIRDDMFAHMQTLPLRYFDTHTHGDVMSYYTNDTDTLRQMISQSLPQVVSAAVTLVTVLVSMLSLSLYLTAFAILYVCLMLVISRKIAARSGKYFVRQQKSIGDLNGYVEEMINGQRVVKVFCHEEAAEKDFDRRNEELCHNTSRANGYGNMLMPVMVSLSSLLYVLMAIIGGSLAIAGVPNFSLGGAGAFTLGTIASFMQLSRSFTQPINQVSQQLNSVVMALAGAGRIFQLMDEPSESDEGYVHPAKERQRRRLGVAASPSRRHRDHHAAQGRSAHVQRRFRLRAG